LKSKHAVSGVTQNPRVIFFELYAPFPKNSLTCAIAGDPSSAIEALAHSGFGEWFWRALHVLMTQSILASFWGDVSKRVVRQF
jgi:hypothetical protein